ncbi:MAG: universal stress protein [Pseudomonadota bacterium]
MSLKTILCAYSGDPDRGSGLRHAIALAKRHDALLTGVAKTGGIGFLHRQMSAQLPEAIRAQLDANGRRMLADVADRFTAMTDAAGLAGRAAFVELDPKRDGPIASFARAFDLTVIGHHAAAPYEDDYAAHPDLIALRSGRPVLIVPQGLGEAGVATANVMVAWDGKRAATRAIVSAMPILESGASVTLLSVGHTPRNTDRLLTTLAAHGIAVQAASVEQVGSISDTLLQEADARSADLIVMGAFEHSKFSHDVSGGATTDVLAGARMPLLMAH